MASARAVPHSELKATAASAAVAERERSIGRGSGRCSTSTVGAEHLGAERLDVRGGDPRGAEAGGDLAGFELAGQHPLEGGDVRAGTGRRRSAAARRRVELLADVAGQVRGSPGRARRWRGRRRRGRRVACRAASASVPRSSAMRSRSTVPVSSRQTATASSGGVDAVALRRRVDDPVGEDRRGPGLLGLVVEHLERGDERPVGVVAEAAHAGPDPAQ